MVGTPSFAPFDSTAELWMDYWARFCMLMDAHSVPEKKQPQHKRWRVKAGEVKHISKYALVKQVTFEEAKLPKLEVPITIQGLECQVELDTGNGGNFIFTDVWEQLGRLALQDVTAW
ncbi:hypothetical protein E2C01_055166 [Portunus trituberculatus]|uniref:Uncharacterized protein n=1 Tax=Portunus trituberculatus TaxID=210409 RepID=A0A5B7GU00_PORTR|nr:hypothetical protein [Portunus trituberculatus]